MDWRVNVLVSLRECHEIGEFQDTDIPEAVQAQQVIVAGHNEF
jgi:hypothetical protein